MSNSINMMVICASIVTCLASATAYSQDIILPPPQKNIGMPLMQAIDNRKSTRDFSDQEIPIQVLSNLLWAAYGYNRPQQKMRTVPSAWNVQNMNVYVARPDGLYLYDAQNHSLKLIVNEDVRAKTGTQSFVRNVPVNLVYVADSSMMSGVGERGNFYSDVHAGFIAQNVYLFCASFNLATVVRDLIDRDALGAAMKLKPDQKIILAQSIGYPKLASQVSGQNDEPENPENPSLYQNFPNPFNLETRINFVLSEQAHVIVNIFDLTGQKIKTLCDEQKRAGDYSLNWDGLNDHGERVASGVYFYQLEVNHESNLIKQTRKMLMLK